MNTCTLAQSNTIALQQQTKKVAMLSLFSLCLRVAESTLTQLNNLGGFQYDFSVVNSEHVFTRQHKNSKLIKNTATVPTVDTALINLVQFT